jgi:thiol-disulfide isomerase/thioredoxin
MRIGTPLPSLEGATEWLNGPFELVPGRATLVHFWSVSCGICKENMPRVAELREARRGSLQLVAVHMPRYEADTNLDDVRAAVAANGITEPCAVDNQHTLKDAFGNEHGYVPAYYLFDADGKLKSYAAGERGLAMVLPAIDRLLGALQPVE